jgi:hypothetical protein
MSRIPALLVMPIVYLVALAAVPFVVVAVLCEWATYKLKGKL